MIGWVGGGGREGGGVETEVGNGRCVVGVRCGVGR